MNGAHQQFPDKSQVSRSSGGTHRALNGRFHRPPADRQQDVLRSDALRAAGAQRHLHRVRVQELAEALCGRWATTV